MTRAGLPWHDQMSQVWHTRSIVLRKKRCVQGKLYVSAHQDFRCCIRAKLVILPQSKHVEQVIWVASSGGGGGQGAAGGGPA